MDGGGEAWRWRPARLHAAAARGIGSRHMRARVLVLALLAAMLAAAPAAAATRRARLVRFQSCSQLIHYGQRHGRPAGPVPVVRGAPVPATPAPPADGRPPRAR